MASIGSSFAMLVTLVASVTAVPVTVSIDTTAAPAPFEHRWKRSFGSGHSSLTLRPDWRQHYKHARTQLGLSGVRYHGLFDDDMGPVVPAPGQYNFSLVDSTWDFLIAQGTHPVVELSFMPAFIANCTWHGHCKQDKIGCEGYWCTQCSGHGVGPIVNKEAPQQCHALEFWYQGIKQVPYQNDYSRWHDLVRTTAQHAVDRYGLDEVQRWSFEVWNELWGLRFPLDYMALYNASARAIKSVHPSLRVGGPATAALAHVADFVQQCEEHQIPYDFVSTHHYPTDSCPKGASWDPDCFIDDVLASRAAVAPTTPYYLTEYNVGCCLGYVGHDVSTAAAFIFRTVSALNDHLELYSYWYALARDCLNSNTYPPTPPQSNTHPPSPPQGNTHPPKPTRASERQGSPQLRDHFLTVAHPTPLRPQDIHRRLRRGWLAAARVQTGLRRNERLGRPEARLARFRTTSYTRWRSAPRGGAQQPDRARGRRRARRAGDHVGGGGAVQ